MWYIILYRNTPGRRRKAGHALYIHTPPRSLLCHVVSIIDGGHLKRALGADLLVLPAT